MRTDDFRPAAMSRTIANRARRAAACRRSRRAWHRNCHHHRLISWYFGIDPSVLLNGAQILTGGGSTTQQTDQAPQFRRERRPTRLASSSRSCSATPRIAGPKSSPPAGGPIIRRNCGCSPAPSRRLVPLPNRQWGRSTAARSAHLSRHLVLRRYAEEIRRLLEQFRLQVLGGLCDRHEVGHHVQNELGICRR